MATPSKQGGCLCGKIRIEYEGDSSPVALCHCTDCRKVSGSAYSTNILVPSATLKVVSGTPKIFTITADTGRPITSHFCGDCGTTLWRDGPGLGDRCALKAGTLDDPNAINETKPSLEFFVPRRANWIPETPGAAQLVTH
ncbi:Mss4-like protein [Hypoxylon fragiforme]|uniref:Mss4-like protein n=1 Tax=Hypoxylon fragiforme TaxID=63214 RepID=UPI0020C72E6A|nr:Mss4-like protein [Hypoxylon fragiforme]KAI2609952.1 Mss4-like protein [Hypoxylon fragiforme]